MALIQHVCPFAPKPGQAAPRICAATIKQLTFPVRAKQGLQQHDTPKRNPLTNHDDDMVAVPRAVNADQCEGESMHTADKR